MPTDRIQIGPVDVDLHTFPSAVERICTMTGAGVRLVVTPNLDHLVRLRTSARFREIYAQADLVLADGTVMSWLSRIAGRSLPDVLTGVGVFEQLCRTPRPRPLRVFLLGGRDESNAAAVEVLSQAPYTVEVVGAFSGMVDANEQDSHLLAMLHEAQPDVVAVCLGSPKQEEWVVNNRDLLPSAVYMGLGATLGFVGGTTARAPEWMQRAGMEWIHRLAGDPKRLWKRYAVDALHLPAIAVQALRQRFRSAPVSRPVTASDALIVVPSQALPSIGGLTHADALLQEREIA